MTTRAAVCAFMSVGIFIACLSPGSSPGQNLTVLRKLAVADGWCPMATPVISGTTLYGAMYQGGSSDGGTIYKMNTDGTGYTVLKNFGTSGPRNPRGNLILSGSTLYGTSQNGGFTNNGTVFKINVDGSGYAVLKQFTWTDGSKPISPLLLSGSTLYGTTAQGGTYDYGTIFKINTDGTGFSVLKHFALTDGMSPQGSLAISGTTLYGTTYAGGSSAYGTIYKISTSGSGYSILRNFASSGGHSPDGGLLLVGSTLYGTTYAGGTLDVGTLFKLQTDGTAYTVLTDFCSTNGANPYASLTLSGSNIFGTTYGGGATYRGTLFKIHTNGTGFTMMKSLEMTDGSSPYAGLAVSGTNYYGACYAGGSAGGTLFSFNMGPPPVAAPAITSQPVSRTNAIGTTASFQVGATPTNNVWFQWRLNGTNLVNGANISGATTNALTIANVQPSDAGNYTVVVTNSSGAVTSSVAVLVVNRPPIAGTDAFTIPLGLYLTVPESRLLLNDSDPEGGPFGLASVQATSDGGTSVGRYLGNVTYYGGFSGTSDHFTYTITNAHGLAAVGNVNITLTGWLPATNQLSVQAMPNGDVRAIYLGWLTLRYALDRTHNLNPPQVWEPLQTNSAGMRGYTFFTNTPAPGTNNYYRIRRTLW